MMETSRPDLDEIRQTYELLVEPGAVTELRGLHYIDRPAPGRRQFPATISGYYNNADAFAKEAERVSPLSRGTYIMLNPVKPEYLARRHNRAEVIGEGDTTKDSGIARRRWFALDLDPVRITGISATDREKELAMVRCAAVASYLSDAFGFPEPVRADAGNSGHLLYRIDLPNDAASRDLLKACLDALDVRFSDDSVNVDTGNFNAARIWKLYGSLARKGDHTPERPHRVSRILHVPDVTQIVPVERLQALAETLPQPEGRAQTTHQRSGNTSGFAVEDFMARHGIGSLYKGTWGQSEKWLLAACPFNSEHTDKSAVIVRFSDGRLGFRCHHNSCKDRSWRDVRDLFEPNRHQRSEAMGTDPVSLGEQESAKPNNPQTPDEEHDTRPVIQITTHVTPIIDCAESAIDQMEGRPLVFQRSGRVCMITEIAQPPKWLSRPSDAPTIAPVSQSYLWELASRAAQWQRYDRRSKKYVSALPPEWVSRGLTKRPGWRFPFLTAVISTPTLRPDGSVIEEPGYDADTGLFFAPGNVIFPRVPEHPSLSDAQAALETLAGLFQDFPFEHDSHKASVIACILTILVRHVIAGPVPLWGISSTAPGSGKGLLADSIALIGHGRMPARYAQTQDDEEERKRLITIALSGDPILLIDNVTLPLGSAPLDAVLTSETIGDRLLGTQSNTSAPWQTVVIATGNNLTWKGDVYRRVMPVVIDPQEEHPESRKAESFKYPDLKGYITDHRAELAVDGLTIVKAYIDARKPKQELDEIGGFEKWNRIIRHTLVWVGAGDPAQDRPTWEDSGDTGRGAMSRVLQCWHDCYGDHAKLLREVIGDIEQEKTKDAPGDRADLADALAEMDDRYDGGKLNAKRLGSALRKHHGFISGSLRWQKAKGEDKKNKVQKWQTIVLEPNPPAQPKPAAQPWLDNIDPSF